MLKRRGLFVIFALTYFLETHGADKYTDENRPYEFGFKIDGEQHRHEKKDENGLIMGEFGFITADGVYHVTVYATDENGNFKILSMKNIRVKPYPTGPERQGHSLPISPPSKPETPAPAPNVPKPGPAAPARTCSHCSLPTTTTIKPLPADIPSFSAGLSGQSENLQPNSPQYSQGTQQNRPSQNAIGNGQAYQGGQNMPGQSNSQGNSGSNYPETGSKPSYAQPGSGNYPTSGSRQNIPQSGADGRFPQSGSGQNYPQPGTDTSYNQPGNNPNYSPGTEFGQNGNAESDQQYPLNSGAGLPQSPERNLQTPLSDNKVRNPKQFTNTQEQLGTQGNTGTFSPGGANGPAKPMLISAQMQIVDKNTDIYNKKPGEREGLPDGLNKDDMLQLLYTFNYTVGFHAHFEEGYTNGAKQGYYYVTGRNGIRTRVDYVADDKGFRPKITQEVLDLLSDDVPKPETEKDEKYGLKGYEFKWLYYPVESRTR